MVPINEELQSVGSCASMYEVNRKVLPELSARWTSTIEALGKVTPGFSAVMAGSFHLVILPE